MKFVLLICLVLMTGTVSAASESPLSIIKNKDKELQQLLKKKNRSKDSIKRLINDIFDFKKMGQKAISSSVWDAQPVKKQEQFVANFKEMVENSSVKKLEVYEADSMVYEAPEITKSKAKITAHMWNKGAESVLIYKMEEENGVWMAHDLIIDDLSTVRNYREQFKKIIEDKGFDELLKVLKDKAVENAK